MKFLFLTYRFFCISSHIPHQLGNQRFVGILKFPEAQPHSFLVYTLNPSSLNSNQDFSHCSSSTRTLCLKHLNEKILTLGKGRGRHVV